MRRNASTSPALPTHGEIKKPLLELLRKKPEVSLEEATAFVAKKFSLSVSARKRMQPCGKETVLQNRIRWARWELKREGTIKTTRRGYFAMKNAKAK